MKTAEFYRNIRLVLLDTENFFSKAKKEENIKRALRYFSIFTIIFLLFTTYYYLTNINAAFQEISIATGLEFIEIPVNTNTFILFFLFFTVFFIAFAFARYWFVHLFVKLFREKATYKDTYKALSYSVAPGYLGGPFLLGWFLIIPFLDKAWGLTLFVIFMAAYILLELYSLYLRSKALSIMHSISFWKAFLSIYILGFLALIIAVIAIYIVLVILIMIIALLFF